MKILVSNDDGVNAPGIHALASALSDLGELLVVAPDRNHSGASNSLTLSRPLFPQQLANGFWSVDGTPTDCVHLAVTGLFGDKPDLVVSGINHGANLGDDVLYSGTIAAASEGRHLGLPAIAVSLTGETNFATAAQVIHQLVKSFTSSSGELQLPPKSLLNVNVPDLPLFALKGWEATRLGQRKPSGGPVKITDPRGNDRYWIGSQGAASEASAGTDFHAIANNKVSITPIHFDMTLHPGVEKLDAWLNQQQLGKK